jgi:selenocysteine-specific translation elongation factor
MTETKREILKDLSAKIQLVEARIVELEKDLRSDILSMRNRLNLQQTLETNKKILEFLKKGFWAE